MRDIFGFPHVLVLFFCAPCTTVHTACLGLCLSAWGMIAFGSAPHFFAWCMTLWLVSEFPINVSCSPKVNFASSCSSCSKMVHFPHIVWYSSLRKNRCLTFHDCKIVLLLVSLILTAPEVLTRRWWVHPMNCVREEKGEFIYVVLRLWEFPEHFHKETQMTVNQFDELLNLLEPHIKKQRTNYRKPISPEQRLTVCLRYVSHLCWNMQKILIHSVTQTKHDNFTSCDAWSHGGFSGLRTWIFPYSMCMHIVHPPHMFWHSPWTACSLRLCIHTPPCDTSTPHLCHGFWHGAAHHTWT